MIHFFRTPLGARGRLGAMSTLTAVALSCSLKPSPEESSSEVMARHVLTELSKHGVSVADPIRVADHNVKFGTGTDMGDGDGWPAIREQILAADILVLATPIWMGHPASVASMVTERLDAESSQTGDDGRPTMFGKVALVAVVGNEDGAHNVTADMMQALNDVGFSLPAQGGTYWVGEAMGDVVYKDLPAVPEAVAETTATAARNAAHLARLLADNQYPA